jgi:hypothetical protein
LHINHYFRCVFNTTVFLKGDGKLSPEAILRSDNAMTSYHNLFKILGLYFLTEAVDSNKVDFLTTSSIANSSRLLDELFSGCLEKMFIEVPIIAELKQYESVRRVIDPVQHAAKTYCWMFLCMARKEDIVQKLYEEFYLICEIEAFKKRK